MAAIDALMMTGVTPEDELRALADSLRGNQGFGAAMSISPTERYRNYGKSLVSDSQNAAKTAGARRKDALKQAAEQKRWEKEQRAAKRKQDFIESKATRANFYDSQDPTRNINAIQGQGGEVYQMNPDGEREMVDVRGLTSGVRPQESGQGTYKQTYKNAHNIANPKQRGVATMTQDGPMLMTQEGAVPLPHDWVLGDPSESRTKMSAAAEKAKLKSDKAMSSSLSKVDEVASLITSPMLGKITGRFDPTKVLYQEGMMDDTGEAQKQTKAMKSVILEDFGKNLEPLGINPTDMDALIAMGPLPDENSQPAAWVDFAIKMRKTIESAEKRERAAGNPLIPKAEEYAKVYAKLDAAIAKGGAMWKERGFPSSMGDSPREVAEAPTESNEAKAARLRARIAELKGG